MTPVGGSLPGMANTPAKKTSKTKITMPKLPAGVTPAFNVGDLVAALGDREHGEWFQFDDKMSVQLRGYVSDKIMFPLLQAELSARANPGKLYVACRLFMLEAVREEHRPSTEVWLDEAGLPGPAIVDIARAMFKYVCGIPFDAQPEDGDS